METKHFSKRIIQSLGTLIIRQIIITGVGFVTINIFLARILPVEVIGVFDIANFVLSFFTFFSDIGLGGALIQKRQLDGEDLTTTFTIQESLTVLLVVIIWLFAPLLATYYKLDDQGMWLIRILAIGFFLSSLKSIPSLLLERSLRFGPISLVDVSEAVIFNGLLIGLVLMGYQIPAFSWAVIGRNVTGLVLIYILSPWKVGLGISKTHVKGLLNFGVPFQLNSLLALLKDRLVPLVIAGIVGKTGVGYIGWAESLAFFPLMIMDNVIRITFPYYSRLQDDREALKKAIEQSLFITGVLLYPVLFGILAIAPSLIGHVVGVKWQPALPLVYFYACNTFWATLSSPFTNAFNALGKVHITLRLMVMWTVLTWALSPWLAYQYGFIGPSLASALIAFTSIVPLWIVRRMLKIQIWASIWQPLLSAVVMGATVMIFARVFSHDQETVVVAIVFGALVYVALLALLAKDRIVMTAYEMINRRHD